jgi:hypothetical protein
MNIHPIWAICIAVRVLLIFVISYLYENNTYNILGLIILLTIGFGFLFKAITGSNNEKQVAKVFWHETRYIHSAFYLLAGYYFYMKKIDMCKIILIMDVLFSFTYRIVKNV